MSVHVVTPLAALYEWLLFLHVLAGMVWLGGAVVVAALGTLVVRRRDVEEVVRFSAMLRRIGPAVLAPAPPAVVAFGVWLVVDSPAWAFSQAWLETAVALFGAAFLGGAIHQARAAIGAERAAAAGRQDEAVRLLRRWVAGAWVLAALLVVLTWDMVLKPGF